MEFELKALSPDSIEAAEGEGGPIPATERAGPGREYLSRRLVGRAGRS